MTQPPGYESVGAYGPGCLCGFEYLALIDGLQLGKSSFPILGLVCHLYSEKNLMQF